MSRKVADGYEAAGKSFKVHLDGYDQRDRAGPSKSARNTQSKRLVYASSTCMLHEQRATSIAIIGRVAMLWLALDTAR
jgi:hypothetical protein